MFPGEQGGILAAGWRAVRWPSMNHDERLAIHLELCERIFKRMQRDGSWPWKQVADSPNPEDLIESRDNQNDL